MSLQKELLTFTTERFVKLYHPVLGITNRAIQAAVLSAFMVTLFVSHGAYYAAVPTASVSFQAMEASLESRLGDDLAYCERGFGDYGDRENCAATRANGFGSGCDFGSRCRIYDVDELSKIGEGEIFFPTRFKHIETYMGACGDAFEAMCADAGGTPNAGDDAFSRYGITAVTTTPAQLYYPTDLESEFAVLESEVTGQCRCRKMENTWPKGIEGLAMQFSHRYMVSDEKIPDNYRGATNVRTTVLREGDSRGTRRTCRSWGGLPRTPCTFDRGENVYMQIEDWLEMAGVDLDAENEIAAEGRTPFSGASGGDLAAINRLTGTDIILRLEYDGNAGLSDVELYIFVDYVGGWHERGSDVHYVTVPQYNETQGIYTSGHMENTVARGITFKVEVGGAIRSFDWLTFIVTLMSATVALNAVQRILAHVAFSYMGDTSEVLTNASGEALDMDQAMSSAILQAAIMASAFRSIANGEDFLRKGDLKALFIESGMDAVTAARLTKLVMAKTATKLNKQVTFQTFCRMASIAGTPVSDLLNMASEAVEKEEEEVEDAAQAEEDKRSSLRGFRKSADGANVDLLGFDLADAEAPATRFELPPGHDNIVTITVPPDALPGSTIVVKDAGPKPISVIVPPDVRPGQLLAFNAVGGTRTSYAALALSLGREVAGEEASSVL